MGWLRGMSGMATTVAVIAFVEVLSIGAGVAIGRILWAQPTSEGQVAQSGAGSAKAEVTTERSGEADNAAEATNGQLEPGGQQPPDQNMTPKPIRSMLEMRASLDADVLKAHSAINAKYLCEVTRLCEELLDRTDRAREGSDANAFELEQFKSQVETSMNNLKLFREGSSALDIGKTLESEVNKICAQIEHLKI